MVSISVSILLVLSSNVKENLGILYHYFAGSSSEEKPLDSGVYAMQLITVLSDYLVKKQGASVPENIGSILQEELDFDDATITLQYQDSDVPGFEIITIRAIYTTLEGEREIVRRILRRK